MSTAIATHNSEAEIQTLMDHWLKAVQALDVPEIMSCYAPDVLAYDAVSQLQFKGADAYGKHWKSCLEMCPGPMVFEIHNLKITADEDVAFAHYLTRCGGIDEKTGEEKTSWMRATECFRRITGKWKIVHEHFSAPFDMEGSKALLDLQP